MKAKRSKSLNLFFLSAKITESDHVCSHEHFVSGLVFTCPLTGVLCWLKSGAAILQYSDSPITIFVLRPIRASWLGGMQARLPLWVKLLLSQSQRSTARPSQKPTKSQTYLGTAASKNENANPVFHDKTAKKRIYLLGKLFKSLQSWLKIGDKRTIAYMCKMSRNGWEFSLDDFGHPLATSGDDEWCFDYISAVSKEIKISNVTPSKSDDGKTIYADIAIGYNRAAQVAFQQYDGMYVFAPTLETLKQLQIHLDFDGFADAIRYCGPVINAQLVDVISKLHGPENEAKKPIIVMAHKNGSEKELLTMSPIMQNTVHSRALGRNVRIDEELSDDDTSEFTRNAGENPKNIAATMGILLETVDDSLTGEILLLVSKRGQFPPVGYLNAQLAIDVYCGRVVKEIKSRLLRELIPNSTDKPDDDIPF